MVPAEIPGVPPARILASLVRAGLVDSRTACEGAVSFIDLSRSNPVHVVAIDTTPAFVVKQNGPAIDGEPPVAVEREVYRWLARYPALAEIAPSFVPTGAGEGGEHFLITHAVADASTPHAFWRGDDREIRGLTIALARTLAHLHGSSARAAQQAHRPSARRPWVLGLPASTAPDFVTRNPSAHELTVRLRNLPWLVELLRAADAAWCARSLMHGDVKWDNVLARRGTHGDGSSEWRIWLVDWELAGWGDPTWDVAALVENVLSRFGLFDGGLDVHAAGHDVALAISTYCESVDATIALRLEQLIQLVAVRLVQVAIQLAAMSGIGIEVSADLGLVLDVARSIAAEPSRWIADIIGPQNAGR